MTIIVISGNRDEYVMFDVITSCAKIAAANPRGSITAISPLLFCKVASPDEESKVEKIRAPNRIPDKSTLK